MQHNKVDPKKFLSLKAGIGKLLDIKGKQVTQEEMIDQCKSQFSDLKFIDNLAKFCVDESEPHKDEGGDQVKVFISLEKVNLVEQLVSKMN